MRVIAKISAGNLSSYLDLPIVITEGESGQLGALHLPKAEGPKATSVTLFSDATSPHFEGATLAPEGATGTLTVGIGSPVSAKTLALVGLALVVIAVVVIFLVPKKRYPQIAPSSRI